MQRYATVKLQILVVPVVLALVLCGCSKDASEMITLKDSAAETAVSTNDASHAGDSVENATLGTAGQMKDAGREARDGAPTAGQKAEEGDRYRASNFNCDTVAPQDKAQCRRYNERGKSAAPLDKNSAGLVALLILFRGHPGDRIWPNEGE